MGCVCAAECHCGEDLMIAAGANLSALPIALATCCLTAGAGVQQFLLAQKADKAARDGRGTDRSVCSVQCAV